MGKKIDMSAKNNKLIAEFMCDSFIALREDSKNGYTCGYNNILFDTWADTQIFCNGLNAKIGRYGKETRFIPFHVKVDMKYHTSWDWLIPVVSKISTIQIKDIQYTYTDLLRKYNSLTHKNDIESLYFAVVMFIKQHNKDNALK